MDVIYLDSSVALRALLDVPERVRVQQWMENRRTAFVSSRLLRTEVVRVLRREGLSPADGKPLLDRVGLIELSRGVHSIAESFERHVKTLDALHLATALLVGPPVRVASHDKTVQAVAATLGLPVIDPVLG